MLDRYVDAASSALGQVAAIAEGEDLRPVEVALGRARRRP
jgi:hypothetical protein